MLKWIQILIAIVSMLPTVIELMGKVQTLFGTGTGAKKLETVKTVLQSTYETGSTASVAFEEVWPKLEKVISGIKGIWGADTISKVTGPTSLSINPPPIG